MRLPQVWGEHGEDTWRSPPEGPGQPADHGHGAHLHTGSHWSVAASPLPPVEFQAYKKTAYRQLGAKPGDTPVPRVRHTLPTVLGGGSRSHCDYRFTTPEDLPEGV